MKKLLFVIIIVLFCTEYVLANEPFIFENHDFRHVDWGMNETDVRATEDKNWGKHPLDEDSFYIVMTMDILEEDCFIAYYFKKNQLYNTQIIIKSEWENPLDGWKAYQKFINKLSEIYGDQPTGRGEPIWKSEELKNDPERWGEALLKNQMYSSSHWESERTHIGISTIGRAGRIMMSISFMEREK